MSDAEPRPALDDDALAVRPSASAPGPVREPAHDEPVHDEPVADEPVADEPADDDPEGTAFVQVTRRRAPRYRAFVLTGIGVAVLVSLVAALVSDPADGYTQRQLFGFLLVSLGVVGAILGGLVAVLVERRR